MILPSQYYEEKLYPLQDGVMNTISKCGVRFFLTGGTALSRAYYNHRYSDDLDFFVNNDDDYLDQVKEIFFKLKEDGFDWDPMVDFVSNKTFTSFKVRWKKSDAILKSGMVITIEPGIYIPNVGGVRIEDMVVVTDEGYKNFSLKE